ncbi:MAG: hypothetical protein M3Y06_10985 [Actinomycetota bacterium]|nr:hypothetical protein [Actinomycetota bacterium]
MPHAVDHSVEAESEAEWANWRWLFADAAGVAMSGTNAPEVIFVTQKAAEDWLGEEFQVLSDAGIATVTLMDGEHAVYGPMYLTPDGGGAVAEAEF